MHEAAHGVKGNKVGLFTAEGVPNYLLITTTDQSLVIILIFKSSCKEVKLK